MVVPPLGPLTSPNLSLLYSRSPLRHWSDNHPYLFTTCVSYMVGQIVCPTYDDMIQSSPLTCSETFAWPAKARVYSNNEETSQQPLCSRVVRISSIAPLKKICEKSAGLCLTEHVGHQGM
jgi:hypothetical protein